MNARDHTLIEELLAVQSLGGLDGDDLQILQRARDAHGDCAECLALESGFRETAGRLGFALDPVPVDGAVAERILADRRPARVAAVPTVPDELAERRSRGTGRRWVAAGAVAAALVLVVGAFAAFLRPTTTDLSRASSEQRVLRFTATRGDGELAMAYTPGQPGLIFWGSHLPQPGEGRVLEIWRVHDGTPTSAGCVTPADGRIASFVDAEVGDADLMAVTEEAASCPSSPTGPTILSAPIQV